MFWQANAPRVFLIGKYGFGFCNLDFRFPNKTWNLRVFSILKSGNEDFGFPNRSRTLLRRKIIFLRGGFCLRNPNLHFMDLPVLCSFWKSKRQNRFWIPCFIGEYEIRISKFPNQKHPKRCFRKQILQKMILWALKFSKPISGRFQRFRYVN